MTANSLVETWNKERASGSRDQFRSRHPYAFLVWSPNFKSRAIDVRPSVQQMAFHTQVHGADTRLVPVAQTTGHDAVMILPLRKGPESPFPDRVSVGRAPNCDLVVRDSSVSKLHGHFRDITLNAAVFTDAKSANGTTLDGVKLEPGVATPVSEFSVIAFGRVRLRLLSPGAVYDWLGQQR